MYNSGFDATMARKATMSRSVNTVPVGLCGEFKTMALVFAVILRFTSSQSIRYSG